MGAPYLEFNLDKEHRMIAFNHWVADWAQDPQSSFTGYVHAEAHLALLDTVACMIAGRSEIQSERCVKAMLGAGETGTVVPVGGGAGLVLGAAALVNGVRAHALDFDDYEAAGSTHPSASILGALLAVAQRQGLSVSDITTAWLVGYEVIVRLGQALGYGHYLRGWHATSTLGPIGTSAAVAVALGLDKDGIANAMSLATSASAGMKLQFATDTKALHAGLAARAGLQAAFLAESGLTAVADIWDGAYGFLDLYGAPSSSPLRNVIATAQLGNAVLDYPILRKPWPSCAYTHRAIEAALALNIHLKPNAGQIAQVSVRMPEPFARVAGIKSASTAAQARFSTTYCVATALLKGSITLADFAAEALTRSDVQTLASRIVLDQYPLGDELEDLSAEAPDTVEITLHDGRSATRTIGDVRGGPMRPMNRAEIESKFLSCGGSANVLQLLKEDRVIVTKHFFDS
jgi:2-methylcitrate dehydratase PrpD